MDNEQIADFCQRFYLTRKNVIEAEIISRRREQRAIGSQRDCGVGAPVSHVTDDILGRHVLCIGCRSAVTAKKQGATTRHRIPDHFERFPNIGFKGVGDLEAIVCDLTDKTHADDVIERLEPHGGGPVAYDWSRKDR